MTDTKPSTKRSSSARTSGNVLSDEERAAMQETIRERKKAAKRSPEEQLAAGEADVQAKIAEMAEDDRAIATRIHELVLTAAPGLVPRTPPRRTVARRLVECRAPRRIAAPTSGGSTTPPAANSAFRAS